MSGFKSLSRSLKSPRSVICNRFLCLERSWMTTLKPRSTKYVVGNATRSFLTTVHSAGQWSEISFCNENGAISWTLASAQCHFTALWVVPLLSHLPQNLKKDLSPNLEFPSKEDPDISLCSMSKWSQNTWRSSSCIPPFSSGSDRREQWNSLPPEVMDAPTLDVFLRRDWKTICLTVYRISCLIKYLHSSKLLLSPPWAVGLD